jgi:hypothetical protein
VFHWNYNRAMPGVAARRVLFSPTGTRRTAHSGQIDWDRYKSEDWMGKTARPLDSLKKKARLRLPGRGPRAESLLRKGGERALEHRL